MLSEAIEKRSREFAEAQEALVNFLGSNTISLLESGGIREAGISYGEPPFIVDDGDFFTLLVQDNGEVQRLAPGLRLSDDVVNEDYDALATLPGPGDQPICFIPANPDYEFNFLSSTKLEINPEVIELASGTYDQFMDTLSERIKLGYVDRTIALQDQLSGIADKLGIDIDEFMDSQGTQVILALYVSLAKEIKEASNSIVKQVKEHIEELDEDDE